MTANIWKAFEVLQNRKRWCVHDNIKKRNQYGAYNRLVRELQQDLEVHQCMSRHVPRARARPRLSHKRKTCNVICLRYVIKQRYYDCD